MEGVLGQEHGQEPGEGHGVDVPLGQEHVPLGVEVGCHLLDERGGEGEHDGGGRSERRRPPRRRTELGEADCGRRAQDDGEGGDPPPPEPGDQIAAGRDGHGEEEGQARGGDDGAGPLLPAEVLAEPEGQDGDEERELQRQDGLDDGEAADVEGEGLEEESGDEAHAAEQPHLPADGIGDQAEMQGGLRRGVFHAHALEDGGERIGQRSRDGEHIDHLAHLPVVGRPACDFAVKTPISVPVFLGPASVPACHGGRPLGPSRRM